MPAYEAYKTRGFRHAPEVSDGAEVRRAQADRERTLEERAEVGQLITGPKFASLEEVSASLHEKRDEDLLDSLGQPLTLRAFTGPRSATAALEACRVLMSGDAAATIKWMNQRLVWSDFTPLELAEQGDEGLQMVLHHIGRIDAGVYF